MVYSIQKGGSRGGAYLAQLSCNSIAMVWAIQWGGQCTGDGLVHNSFVVNEYPVKAKLVPTESPHTPPTLRVQYGERGNEYDILFICSLFCECIDLGYVRIHVIYRVQQAEYVFRTHVAAPQEYVNTYSTCRLPTLGQRKTVQCA